MFCSKQIIKGERLQQLADVYFGYDEDFHYNPMIAGEPAKHCNINSIITQYNNPPTIFCYTHRLVDFAQIIKYFENPFVLITHNSDGIVDANETTNYLLTQSKIVRWYAQNVTVHHEKLRVLPIGMANDQWPHGNTDKIMENINTTKTKSIYFNFNISTNVEKRQDCYNKLLPKLTPDPPVSPEEYHKILSQYEFCICPEGNGVDTHRLWEALYLKCIPIVLQSSHIDILRTQLNIPLVVLQSWDELDISNLHYTSFSTQNADYYTKLRMDYYNQQIAKDAENCSNQNITLIPSVALQI